MRIRKSFALAFMALCLISAYLGMADLEVKHDKILHFVTFFLLSMVFYWIVEASRGRVINMTLVVCTLIGGIGSEFLQGFLPYRTFDPRDIIANIAGSLLAILACATYHKRLLERRRAARYDRLRGVDPGSGDDSLRDIEAQTVTDSTELGPVASEAEATSAAAGSAGGSTVGSDTKPSDK